MAWTSPRTWVAGEVVTAALLNLHLRDNLNAKDNEVTAWRSVGTTMNMTDPTSYTVLPNSTERTALTTSFTKRSASTAVVLEMHVASLGNSSGLTQVVHMGMKFGGVDYDVAQGTILQANAYLEMSAVRPITGLAAGTYSAEPILRTDSTMTLVLSSSYTTISYRIREVFSG